MNFLLKILRKIYHLFLSHKKTLTCREKGVRWIKFLNFFPTHHPPRAAGSEGCLPIVDKIKNQNKIENKTRNEVLVKFACFVFQKSRNIGGGSLRVLELRGRGLAAACGAPVPPREGGDAAACI